MLQVASQVEKLAGWPEPSTLYIFPYTDHKKSSIHVGKYTIFSMDASWEWSVFCVLHLHHHQRRHPEFTHQFPAPSANSLATVSINPSWRLRNRDGASQPTPSPTQGTPPGLLIRAYEKPIGLPLIRPKRKNPKPPGFLMGKLTQVRFRD